MKISRSLIQFNCFWLLFGSVALAADPSGSTKIILESGEVLIGRILSETDETVAIDSASLGIVEVRAEDIRKLEDDRSASLPAERDRELDGEGGKKESFLRKKVPDSITASIHFGLDLSNADVAVRNYLLEARFRWKGEKNEIETRHLYEYLSIDDHRATDLFENSVRWIYPFGARSILLSQANWLRDEGMGIDYRIDALLVPGFYFVKTEDTTLLAGIGPAYEWEKWDRPGESGKRNFNIAVYELFRYRIRPMLTFEQTFLGYLSPEEEKDHRFRLEAGLQQMLTDSISTELKFTYDFDNSPPPGFPKKQDRLMATVGYDF